MTHSIDTIFFDVGATLRYVVEDKEFAAEAERQLMELVGSTEEHDAFFARLEKNWKAYRKQAKTCLLDVSEMELWLQYLLPDYPAERVAPHAARLTRLWRDHDGRRVVHEGTLETLRELTRRGYKLGIIANTITETEIPDWMCRDQVADCFKTVILSSKVRLRKPDPAIWQLGVDVAQCDASQCIAVGDSFSKDIIPAHTIGCQTIWFKGSEWEPKQFDETLPSHIITSLDDILTL